jgi:small multidrug resistance pump
MNIITLLIGAGILVTGGDLMLAEWALHQNPLWLLAGLALNLFGIILYAISLQYHQIGAATAIFLGLNIVAITLGGLLIFGQRISLRHAISILMIIVSIGVIEI